MAMSSAVVSFMVALAAGDCDDRKAMPGGDRGIVGEIVAPGIRRTSVRGKDRWKSESLRGLRAP